MKKILILEDEGILAGLYKKYLERAGHEVVCSNNIKQSEELIKTFKADLLFIDHGIKDEKTTGVDFLKKAKKILPKAKMIMLTNYSNTELQTAAKKAGSDDFLIKLNTSPKILVQYVDKLFS